MGNIGDFTVLEYRKNSLNWVSGIGSLALAICDKTLPEGMFSRQGGWAYQISLAGIRHLLTCSAKSVMLYYPTQIYDT